MRNILTVVHEMSSSVLAIKGKKNKNKIPTFDPF